MSLVTFSVTLTWDSALYQLPSDICREPLLLEGGLVWDTLWHCNCWLGTEQTAGQVQQSAEWRAASQKRLHLCLIGSTGSSTQTVGFKVHLWGLDLLLMYRQWRTAGFVSISYVWRKSPYFSKIEHDTIFSFWPSLIAGFDAAYEVDKRDRVLFFKGISLTFPSVLMHTWSYSNAANVI